MEPWGQSCNSPTSLVCPRTNARTRTRLTCISLMPAGMDPIAPPAALAGAHSAGKSEGKLNAAATSASQHTPASDAAGAAAAAADSMTGLSLSPEASRRAAPKTPGPTEAPPTAGGASPLNAPAEALASLPHRPGAARRGLSFPSTASPPAVLGLDMAAPPAMSPLPTRPGLAGARSEGEGDKNDGAAPFVEPLLDPTDDRFTMYPIR